MTYIQVDLVFSEAAANMMLKYVTITFAANPQFSTEKSNIIRVYAIGADSFMSSSKTQSSSRLYTNNGHIYEI